MVLVSVIVPAFNASHHIEQTLLSATSQSHLSLEILVVDDGSRDDTALKVKEMVARDPRIRLLRHGQNRGISAARNTALEAATSDYLAFLDGDDLWDTDKLERQLVALEENPDAGLVFTASRVIDAEGAVINDNLCAGKHIPTGRVSPREFIIDRYPVITSSVMIRRRCIDRVGLFDSRYSSAEDFDLWLRILTHYAQCYVPAVLTSYRDLPGSASKHALRNRENKVLLLENLQRENPGITAQMGGDFDIYLHRQYLGLAKLYKQKGDSGQARDNYQKALSLAIPAPLKLRALLLKKRYC